jgi:mRNA-degrading endonuclease toxin of MazEF toxin-antitoxin module
VPVEPAVVAAITSQIDPQPYPTEVLLRPPEGGLSTRSTVLLSQIRSVDRRRLVSRLGRLEPETMARVDRALQIGLGLVEVKERWPAPPEACRNRLPTGANFGHGYPD